MRCISHFLSFSIFVWLKLAHTASSVAETDKQHGRVLVVFAFFDALHARPNLRFFLKHVVGSPSTRHVDVLIVDTTPDGPTVPIPAHPQVRYLHKRNEGFDMCSYKVGLKTAKEGDYAYIVLMNGSMRGPFWKGDFVAPFARLFTENVAMVGSTAACWKKPHIQGMFLMLNPAGVRILNRTLSCDIKTKDDSIYGPFGEINLSRSILREGYGLNVRQGIWRNHDFLNSTSTLERCHAHQTLDDPFYTMWDIDPATLKQRDVDPEEVIFFKTNRRVSPGKIRSLTRSYDAICTSGGCGSWNATLPYSGLAGTWRIWSHFNFWFDIVDRGAEQLPLLFSETWHALWRTLSRSLSRPSSFQEL